VNYLDASALTKLVFHEAETDSLREWLDAQSDAPKVTSQLSHVELLRVARRRDDRGVATAQQVLTGLNLIPIADVIDRAAWIEPPHLRSLDALHLASALLIKDDLTAFVAYDDRLCTAARDAGLHVEMPR
jgi:predicted nucleic acid-binding protein